MPTGVYIRSEEHKKRIGEANTGKHQSEEARRKGSESRKKYPNPNWKGGISKNIDHIRLQKRIHQTKRRSFKKEASGTFTIGEWKLLKKQYGYRCPLCGKKEPEITLTIDHVIPISKGGSNWIENIQPLCSFCNAKKHTRAFKIDKKGQFCILFNKREVF